MSSAYELFWTFERYALIGREPAFPRLTLAGLKKLGKKVTPVEPSGAPIDGVRTASSLAFLPEPVDAVVIEVPAAETEGWVRQAAEAGIRKVWIHDGCETPEALSAARDLGLDVLFGTCAVMYVTPGFTLHAFHRWVRRLQKNY
jgi:uncharacterized protein